MQAHAGHNAETVEASGTAEQSAVVAIYDTHEAAEDSLREAKLA